MGFLWVKLLHILFVIAWFAGLFYLPRIYVNIAQSAADQPARTVLLGMAQRLYRFMFPLALLAVLSGLTLFLYFGIGKGAGWIHAKILFVILLIIFHYFCGRYLKRFQSTTHTPGHVFFRWFNEIPFILLLIILYLVIFKPF
ncbi:MAG TPA: CopD family protein [Paenalcaligenes sp.]|nr:CopD family protein [Paenalcaligenes sp.]